MYKTHVITVNFEPVEIAVRAKSKEEAELCMRLNIARLMKSGNINYTMKHEGE